MEVDVYLTKGSRVRIRTISPLETVALAGMQMKGQVKIRDFWGTVTHVYAYADSKEDFAAGKISKRTVVVKPDDGGPEEEFEQKHICGFDDKTVEPVKAQAAGGAGGSDGGSTGA
jgi:hypothetical protein